MDLGWLFVAGGIVGAVWLGARAHAVSAQNRAVPPAEDAPVRRAGWGTERPLPQRRSGAPKPIAPSQPPAAHQDLALVRERFVVLDFETNGLDASRHQIISVAAVRLAKADLRLEKGQETVAQTYTSLVKPLHGMRMSAKITEITGLTRQDLVNGGEELATVMPQLLDFIGSDPVVAYNAPFDRKFADAACAALGLQAPTEWICALDLARRAWPSMHSHRLTAVTATLGIAHARAHEALSDAQAAAAVYVTACRKLAS